MFKKVDPKVSFPKMEEEILTFWDAEKVFKQSVEKNSADKTFIFYEGPPTANGRPGLHHVLARSFKDIIPRYKTMKGFRVERKAGWDTHGLPVELQVEKALGLRSKQEIENLVPGDARASIIEFNKKCKESVWEYRELWEKLTQRMAYWVDMEHPYVTYENEYIESVWWQLAQIAELKNEKGESFLYRGHKVVPYCYRCGTALSSHEVAQGYQTVKDHSVYVKFKAKPGQKIENFETDDQTYFLAWTTTPWTLPGNVALAIQPVASYVSIEHESEYYILEEKLSKVLFPEAKIQWVCDGKKLVERALEYEPLYAVENKENKKAHYVVSGDFVTTDSGTGIVHIAPAFGEDDANVAKENDLPTILTVEPSGRMVSGFQIPGEGELVKKKNDRNRYAVDDVIVADLKERGLFFKEEVYEHEYPFCWRCDTPLIYYAKPSWFIRMSDVREKLEQNNQAISWVPDHIKEGRFGEWLRGAKDWAISRERYWGTPLPIWVCTDCEMQHVVSSLAELEDLSGTKLDDVHRPYIDDAEWECGCGGTMKRTIEVLDVWFDSGAMPLAQFHYPHHADAAIKEKLEQGKYFPADYICEAIDQTRGWFYTLHAVATLLHEGGHVPSGQAYKNVISLGFVNDAQGKKMSKSKGNIIDPFEMFDQFGADQLRWYLFSLNQPGISKRFDLKGMRDVQNRVFRMLWNSYSFFTTYASIDNWAPSAKASEGQAPSSKNLLDKWILSELQTLIKEVDQDLEKYDVYGPTQKIESFIDNLSNWYIRRSRKRFWKSEDDADKEQAYQTLYDVLVTLSRLMAPFTPFLAEEIYKNLTDQQSVHLADFPEVNPELIDEKLNEEMKLARAIVSQGLEARAKSKMKVRQPLQSVSGGEINIELQEIVKEELNVKEYLVGEVVTLDLNLTQELKLEGEAREIIRAIQEGRKKAGFNVEDRIKLGYTGKESVFENEELRDLITKEVLATSVEGQELTDAEYSDTVKIEGEDFSFSLKR